MTFTAPKSYTETKALMGTDVETPIGTLRCTGAGLAGVDGSGREEFRINFHNDKGNVEISWSNQEGWVTLEEAKTRRWVGAWDKLPAQARALINLVLGVTLDEIEVAKRSDVNKLLRIAKRRLIKTGKLTLKTCSRCAGSGKYSYCQTHGDTCFGCGGTGKVLPTTSEALRAARK